MDKELLKKMIAERLVSVQKHPEADLFIYNYTAKVQYDKLWNEITLAARGLILDAEMNIVARPFGKFFNLEEHGPGEIPQIPFEVYEKLDGSLGILYWLNGLPYIATRGSFESEQAGRANEILHGKYQHVFPKLDNDKTYLFEIIYPENRIVVDYGGMNDLVLLAIIDNHTGHEHIADIGFNIVKKYDGINDLQQLKTLEAANREGFVVRFQNGFRVKMKFAEYIRLHRLVTGISNIAIWEYMRDGKPFDELLERVPDEFYDWVMQTKQALEADFERLLAQAKTVYSRLYDDDKKAFAIKVMDGAKPLSGILFRLYDGKPYEPVIWKMVKPAYSKPFKTGEAF
jgi:RNA ligase